MKRAHKSIFVVLIFFFLFLIYLLRARDVENYSLVLIFSSINFLYLLIKLCLALWYSPYTNAPKEYKVSVVIPSFNEEKESVIKAVTTLLQQTYPIYEIIFIDDGSQSDEAYLAVKNLNIFQLEDINPINKKVNLKSIRLSKNCGKKKAQEIGFLQASGELFLLVDSDGEITKDSLKEMIRPFSDPKVGSVVGRIEVRNLSESFWTKMQDILYSNSFQMGRASQSTIGSVIVCSGALSMHRANFVKRNMSTFRKTTFLGIPCSTGDDRLLTDISLERRFKTVYQSTAICYTDVPVTLKKYFKQQVRWAKSSFIMSLFSLRYALVRPIAILFQLLESYLWLLNLIVSVLIIQLPVDLEGFITASIYFILVAYLSNIFYLKKSVKTYLCIFIYSLAYSVLLLSIRVYGVLTVFETGWKTR